ncbi:MAG: biotin/lipoyl-binding protein [Methylococcaceae bacterium]|nr:biotin/lipoyl-binding protein [Methylococcaceae bacterium]
MANAVTTQIEEKPKEWLSLRDDLTLVQGPRAYDGSPTWTLYDPAVHRYFRIGWLEFECLHRWELGNAEGIIESIRNETPIEIELSDIEHFVEFIELNNLVKPKGRESSVQFANLQHASKPGFWTWLLHNYLFLRVPLIKPNRYLKKALPVMNVFFQRRFIILLVLGICFALVLVSQQWSEFTHSFLYSFTAEGILATMGMMSLSKVVHEMGHAFAASHFGCRVPAMGIALMLGMPVLWTDVTDAWRLPRRKDRLIIDSAGMIAELTLATIATILWTMLPDGPLRSGIYLLASSAWLITLGINLNPFMRFDGYYIMSDLLDMPNLQDRSFKLGLWQLREGLFGFGISPPENFPKKRHRFIVLYAYSIWIYRLILFTGIAWAVYYFFFKILGLALFAVEIGWFIIRPIAKEVGVWRKMLASRSVPIKPRPAWLVPLSFIALVLIPWQSHILVPGLLLAEAEYTLYSIEAAQVSEVFVKEGDFVKPNQVLVKLESPDLDYKIKAAQLILNELTQRLALQSMELKLARNNPVDYEQLQSTRAEIQGLQDVKEKLTIKATFEGHVRDLSDWLIPGEWLAKDEPLGIVESTNVIVIAYAEEADLEKLKVGGEGRFYPEGGDLQSISVTIAAVDKTGTRDLKVEELASKYGGEIAVRPDEQDQLIPEQGLYRVLLQFPKNERLWNSTIRGRLSLATEADSIANRLLRLITVTLVKESGW